MLNGNQRLTLIEKYIDKQLSAKEKRVFEELLQNNAEFGVELQFQQKFLNSLHRLGDELFLTNLQSLEQQIQSERAIKTKITHPLKELTQKTLQKGEEILDDLMTAFLPVSQYEALIMTVNRSSAVQVLKPENGLEVKGDLLLFELEKEVPHTLELSIEDNQTKVLIQKKIPANVLQFEVKIAGFSSGRYYWKLKMNGDVVMRSFLCPMKSR